MPHLIRSEFGNDDCPGCSRIITLLLIALVCSFTLLVAAGPVLAQQVMGPPDDPYTPVTDPSQDGMSPAGRSVSQRISLAAGFANGPLDTLQITSIDPSLFPQICTYVEVLDENGNPISGWDADSFCVRQDTDNITDFSVVEVHDNCVTSVCLVIDVSGSMITDHKIDSAKAAAHAFVNQMGVLDRVAIVTFSYCYTIVQDFTSDQALLHSKINTLYASGYTAAFDGIYKGIELTVPEVGSKAVIALSDGMENYSQNCNAPPDGIRFDDWKDDSTLIVNLALGGGIPVYTLSLGSEFDPTYLQRIAAATGGDYYHAPGPADLNNIYADIKTRLCSRYLICYTSPDLILDGDCHDVFVCHKDPITGSCDHCGQGEYCEPNPPTITIDPLPCQPWDQDVNICATVTDSDTPLADLIVRLFYRNSDLDSYTQVNMTLQGGVFCATIPGSMLPCGGEDIQYYLTASDGVSTVPSPAGAPIAHHTFSVCPNHDPVCIIPQNQIIRQCQPEEVCFDISATDVDGNLLGCHVSDPKGGRELTTSDGIHYCYTPIGSETATITVHCWDDCGGECFSSFTVEFIIDQPPVLTCPPNYTFECDAIGDFGVPTVEDENPETVTLSVDQDSIPGNCANSYQLVRTWTATDECGNKSECTQTIRVFDTVPPIISGVGPDKEIECPTPPVFDDATVDDNCDLNPTLTHEDSERQGACPIVSVLTRTWTATDACGNSSVVSQTITVVDNTPPTISCPNPLTLQCGDQANVDLIAAWLGSVTAGDACGPITQRNTYSPDGFTGGCSPGTGTQTVTFYAVDACGYEASCTSTITIEDTQKPWFTLCPVDLDLQCGDPANEQLIIDWLASATASDQCDVEVTITNNFDRLSYTGGCSDNTGSQLVTWTAVDACGNQETCQATITITDTGKPWFTFCPPDLELECGAFDGKTPIDPIADWLSSATADDQCDINVEVTTDYDPINFSGGCGEGTGAQLVTFTATDDCGNTEICQASLIIRDTQKPYFTFCPLELNLDCGDPANEQLILGWLASATAADQCDPDVDVTNNYDPNGFTGGCSDNTGTQLVTFTATDDCGNTEICQALIVVRDTQKPWFTLCPPNLELECNDPGNDVLIAGWLLSAQALDQCDPEVTVTNDYQQQILSGGCSENTGSILVTFTATDDCGNIEICQSSVIIRDTQKPTFTFCPLDIEIECSDVGPDRTPDPLAGWLNSPTAEDQCDGNVVITNDFSWGNFTGGCSEYTGSQLVTFTATDDCGNFELCQATVTIVDTQKPVFGLCPTDLNLECGDPANEQLILGWLSSAYAFDNCDREVTITNDYDPLGFTGGCSDNTGSQLVTFTATDDCGNTEICQATVSINDTQSPVIEYCPPDLTIDCGDPSAESQILGYIGDAAATDLCDAELSKTDSYDPQGFTGGCSPTTGSQTIVVTFTDDCGNQAFCRFTVTIQDITKPSFSFCPTDLALECNGAENEATIAAWLLTATATDDCDTDVEVTNDYAGLKLAGGCSPNTGSVLVTFTATDDCGNTEICQASVIIRDSQKPSFSFCPTDLELECNGVSNDAEIAAWLLTATATDDCDPGVVVTNDYDFANLSGGCSFNTGSILVTFTATDECGNFEICQASVIIRDTQKPVFSFCPPDLELECNGVDNDAAIRDWLFSASVTDDCDAEVTVSNDYDPFNLITDCSPNTGSILVTFTATDECGNTETCSATIYIRDTQKPYFTFCPPDLDLECSDLLDKTVDPITSWLESALAEDQCDPEVTVTTSYDPQGFIGGCSPYTGSQLVIFTATDDCGNVETCEALITIRDTQKPYFSFCPATLELECRDAGNEASITAWLLTATAGDNCDAEVEITNDYDFANITGGCSPNTGSILVTFTATDDCGNFATCLANVIIRDTEKPSFSFCPVDLDLECNGVDNEATIAAWLLTATATDGCDADVEVTNDYDFANLAGGCSPNTGSILVIFTATDDCGNTEICSASINIRDTEKPYFTTCPKDLDLECGDPNIEILIEDWLALAPVAADLCDPEVRITNDFDYSRLAGGCSNNTGSILVTFTATDACGNTETCQASVNIRDTQKPYFTLCPADLDIECSDLPRNDVDPVLAWLESALAEDQCDREVVVTNDYNPGNFTGGCSPYTGSQLVTFTATDDCGNTETCQATVTITDTQKPWFTLCPEDARIECGSPENEAFILAWLAAATAADLCDPEVEVTNDYDPANFSDDCGETGSQLVTWTATDDCGNTEICQATLYIVDTQKPWFTTCPDDLRLQCGDLGNAGAIGGWLNTAAAEDMCDPEVTITNDFDLGNLTDGCSPNTGSVLVTFTATDDCGNTETCQATLTIYDELKPTFTFCPEDLDLDCSYFTVERIDGILSDWLASATAEDQCDGVIRVTNDFDIGNMTGGCSDYTGDILVTFTATDNCGNSETCVATIHVTDTEKPVFTLCPQDLTLECDYLDPTQGGFNPVGEWLLTAAATDNCDPVVDITNDFDPQNFSGGCGYGTGSQLVTWTATDDCGNTETCQATVTIQDTQPPVCVLPKDAEVFQCANAEICYDLFATDNCDPEPACRIIDGKGTIVNGQWCYTPTVDEVVTVDVECSDACGNTCTGSFTININVNEKPVVEGPADESVRVCEPGQDICVGPFTISDQDNNIAQVYSNLGTFGDGSLCFIPDTAGTYTVAVCAADECQEVVCDTVLVTVTFNNPPICQIPESQTFFLCGPERVCLGFDGIDPDEGDFVTCFASNNFGETSRYDDCRTGDCPRYLWCYTPTKDETIEVTVTCTDECGATCEGTFTVTFVMNKPPTCSAPDPLDLECGAAGNDQAISDWLASATATDDAGPFTITNNYSPDGFSDLCGNTGAQEVTFTVTDSCGVSVSCTSAITIHDKTPPQCEAPDDLTLACDDPELEAKIGDWLASATGSDACGEVSVDNDYNVEAFGGCNGTGSQEVTFTVMDDCENSSTCTAFLTIEDTEAPSCSAPDPLTVECSDPALSDKIKSWLASATGEDNCSAEVVIENDFNVEAFDGCSGTGTQEVTFTVWDACENSSQCTSTITIEDTQSPEIACSGDIDVLCIGDVPEPNIQSVEAFDACGSVTVEHLGDTELIEEPPCGGMITRTYRATDECGNFADCQQRIYVLLGTPICLVPNDPTVEVCALQGEIRLPVSSLICEAGFDGDTRVQPHNNGVNTSTTRRKSTTTVTGGVTRGKQSRDRNANMGRLAASTTVGGRCEVYAGPGFIQNGEWVGYPAQLGQGPTNVTVRCYDDRCGLFCEETFTVNIQVNPAVNQPPTCTIVNPPNPSPSPCGPFPSPPPSQVFILGTDPEGGPVTCGLAPGSPGIVTDCVWEPGGWNPGPGTYPITIQCTDTCGAVSETQFTVTILPQPSSPQCVVPTSNQSYTLCQPGTVTAPVSAIGGVAPVTCSVIGGPGSIVGGQWQYNATVDESFTVTVRCQDQCGEQCESSFDVTIDVNDPPVCNMPDQYFSGCDIIHASASIQVSDDNLSSIKKVSGPGVIQNGVWSYTAGIAGTYTVIFEAKDACNAKTQCAFDVTFDLNDPPQCNLRDTTIVVCNVGDITLALNPTDPDLGVRDGESVTCTLVSGPGSIVGNEWHYHLLEYQPVTLTIRCTDACGLSCQTTITVNFEQGDVIGGLCDSWDDRTITLCGPGLFCLDVPPSCDVVLGQGKVNGINLCFEVQEAGVYWADIECADGCGNSCSSRAYFTVVFDPGMPECGPTLTESRKNVGGSAVSSAGEACPCPLRGDLNYDNEITTQDLSILSSFFTEGYKPADASADCPALNVADVNCDGQLTVQDVQYLGTYLFAGGPAPCTRCASAAASSAKVRPITDLKRVTK